MRRFKAPRRLRFTRAGWLFTLGALAVGVAAIPTGNNLLFLLLGAMLGFIAVSGWLSEQSLRGLEPERRLPRGVTAGRPFRITYRVSNRKRRLPSMSVEVLEPQLARAAAADEDTGITRSAWLITLPAGETTQVRGEHVVAHRGAYVLREMALSTGFPFGLFRKERDVEQEGTLIVWPRSDLPLREPRTAGRPRQHVGATTAGPRGARGEFRGLREYRPGDDPRDVHWRSSARRGAPVVREYEQERTDALWICLVTRRAQQPDPAREEAAVEIAASLARAAIQRGGSVGLATADELVEEGSGPGQLERILDALARVRFDREQGMPRPPVGVEGCVLVSAGAAPEGGRYADVFVAGGDAS